MTIKEMRKEIDRIKSTLKAKDMNASNEVSAYMHNSVYAKKYKRYYLCKNAKKEVVECYLESLINAIYDSRYNDLVF